MHRGYTDPIDGLLLFPTTGCPPEGCPDCTAHALAGQVLADGCHDVTSAHSSLSGADWDFLPLPHCMTNMIMAKC